MQAGNAGTIRLDQLREDRWATVTDVTLPADGDDRQVALRLLELGFVPGERVRVVRASGSRNAPLAVRLGHTTFALRTAEAAFIHVIPAA